MNASTVGIIFPNVPLDWIWKVLNLSSSHLHHDKMLIRVKRRSLR